MPLAAVRARLEQVRPGAGEPLARALIELAELEPLLGHRQPVVRTLLEEAAALLDGTRPQLEGRVLLRLAHVKLGEQDLEGVEQLATRAQDRLGDDPERVLEVGTLMVRALIRRKEFARAESRLAELSATTLADPTTTPARRAAALLVLAWTELALEQQQWDPAREHLEVLESAIAQDDELLEQQFTCLQMRAAIALADRNYDRACHALRAVVAMTKELDAAADNVEARIALAGALTERGDSIGLDEAERHLQISRDLTLERELDSLHLAALIGQAGLLAKKGKTKAALDCCIEVAQLSVNKKDLGQYSLAVALMSQIYEQKGDWASAYRTFAEAHATLRDSLGDRASDLFLPHIRAFADRIGPAKFREIAEQVNKAADARKTFRPS